ncbi:MAG: HdeD family acid-resistance protein [Beijerinckiaceae bacterium]
MASLNPDQTDMQRAINGALKAHWRLFLFQGVIMIILGIVAIALPVAATIAVDIYVGWLFLIAGIVGLVALFSAGNIPAFLWSLITAALAVAVGVLLLWKPVEGAVSLTLVLTAFFIVEGIFQIVTSIAYRDVIGGTWSWMLVSGICDLALAAIIILGWPFSAAWVLGLLVGINLITSGFAIVMAAMAGRAIFKTLTDSTAAAH